MRARLTGRYSGAYLLVSLFLLMLLPQSAVAAVTAVTPSCYDRSPALKNGVDLFQPPEFIPLVEADHEAISTLFKKIRGRWRGKAERFLCTGDETNPGMELIQYEAKVTASWRRRRLSLNVDMTAPKLKTVILETYDFYLRQTELSEERDDEAGNVVILEVGKNRLKVYRRFVARRGQASVPVETGTAISLQGKKLIIKRVRFERGLMMDEITWRLHR